MIENIKTNQIGKFCQGDKKKKCTKKLPELLFLYPFTTCVPCVPQSNRKILSIINTDTSQMSLLNHSKTVRARDLKFEKIITILYVSCVLCHMSDDTCHLSHVTCHIFFTNGGS